jgi:hypothetical protein
MSWFRLALLNRLCAEYTRSLLAESGSEQHQQHREEEEESGLEPDITSDEVRTIHK